MLIKLYATDNTIKIIENVTDVNLHLARFSFEKADELYKAGFGPQTVYGIGLSKHYIQYHPPIDSKKESTNCRLLDYRKDGEWFRLVVDCWAYICNDQGKTVEQVQVGN